MSADDQRNGEAAGAADAGQEAAPPEPPRRLVAGFDLEEETALEVAPIGPTEPSNDGAEPGEGDAAPGSSWTRHAATTEDLERQIRELEARLDRMMNEGRDRAGADAAAATASAEKVVGDARAEAARVAAEAEAKRAAADAKRAAAKGAPEPKRAAAAADADEATPAAPDRAPRGAPSAPGAVTARELLSSDFYLRQWGRAAMRSRAEEVDEFGFDPAYEARYRPLFDFLYKTYFRVEVEGIGHVPDEGRCLVVSNHSGGPIPYDGIMLRAAVRREHPRHRELRWLTEDFVYYLPFAGTVMNRLGAVRACQENAERLLAGGRLVAVFPEGVKGIGKLYKDRYRLQRFGRGGFIRLCLRTRTPLVPCAIVGAEETNPLLYRFEHLARSLGIPYVPITPTFPALGPLGLVPAPTKWKMRFGEVVRFDAYGPEAADDEILVGRLAERVRATIQGLLDETLAERKSIWFG